MSYEGGLFEFKNWSSYVNGVQSQSGGHLSLYVVAQGFSQLCQLLNL